MHTTIETGPWFDHEKRPPRPLYRHPEALALGVYTVPRPLVEGVIMILKVLTHMTRFLAGVAFAKYSQTPYVYVPLGVLAILFGVSEALIGFWKEIAARVHPPGMPTYHTHPHQAETTAGQACC